VKVLNKICEQNAEFLNVNAYYFPLCFNGLFIKLFMFNRATNAPGNGMSFAAILELLSE
jgi:hypothetical protein